MSLIISKSFGSIKRLAKLSVESVSQFVPLSFLLRLSNSTPLVVLYHAVADHELPHVRPLYRHLTTKEFERQVDMLLRQFKPVSLDHVLRWVDGTGSLPANAIYLTFDDGLREIAEIVSPILTRKGVTAAIFVNTAFIDNRDLFYRFKSALLISRLVAASSATINEASSRLAVAGFNGRTMIESINLVTFKARDVLDDLAVLVDLDFGESLQRVKPFMDSAQINKLIDGGFDIGGHSVRHIRYSELSLTEQLDETRKDMNELSSRFALPHRIFAVPFGNTGVSNEFYDSIRREGVVEAVFGTGGWYHDRRRGLMNRLSLESVPQLSDEDLRRSLGVAMTARFAKSGGIN